MSQARLRLADIRALLAACPTRFLLRTHRIPELRVKLKSLAVEIRIIKVEISKVAAGLRSTSADVRMDALSAMQSLSEHNAKLRRSFRAAVIAIGFLRGRLFREIEPSARAQGNELVPLFDAVKADVHRFGPPRVVAPRRQSPAADAAQALTDATWEAWIADALASTRVTPEADSAA